MLSVDCNCICSYCDSWQHRYMRSFELKISTKELSLETAKCTYLMMVIFCVHFHRANHQEKLNLTTNGNNGTNKLDYLDLNFYLGIYAGNCTACVCVCVCPRTIYYLIEFWEVQSNVWGNVISSSKQCFLQIRSHNLKPPPFWLNRLQ